MVKTLHLFVAALAATAGSVGAHPAISNRDSRRFDDLGALVSAPVSFDSDSVPAVSMDQNPAAETPKTEKAVAADVDSSASTALPDVTQTEPFPVLGIPGSAGQLLSLKARGSDVQFDDSAATFDDDDDDDDDYDDDDADGSGGFFFSFLYDYIFFMMVFWFIYWLAFYDSEDSEMEAHARLE